jgi:hypothetical protein
MAKTLKDDRLALSSVKIEKGLLEGIKIEFIRTKFSLQRLVNRSIHLYLTDLEFRNTIHLHNDLAASGSL